MKTEEGRPLTSEEKRKLEIARKKKLELELLELRVEKAREDLKPRFIVKSEIEELKEFKPNNATRNLVIALLAFEVIKAIIAWL